MRLAVGLAGWGSAYAICYWLETCQWFTGLESATLSTTMDLSTGSTPLPPGSSRSGKPALRPFIHRRVDLLVQSGSGDLVWRRTFDLNAVRMVDAQYDKHTFFEIFSPWSSAVPMTFARELAYSMRSLMDESDGQV